jgi:hypothetical protein
LAEIGVQRGQRRDVAGEVYPEDPWRAAAAEVPRRAEAQCSRLAACRGVETNALKLRQTILRLFAEKRQRDVQE